jgi:DNA-binding MarR family transcriptional regulator
MSVIDIPEDGPILLSKTQEAVLLCLMARMGGGFTPHDVWGCVQKNLRPSEKISRSSVNIFLDDLVDQGLLERRKSYIDGRTYTNYRGELKEENLKKIILQFFKF